MLMSYCPSCGTALQEGATACFACGSPLPDLPLPTATTAAPPGLPPNKAGAIAYLAGLITGILFLAIDPYRKDPFVRFHALQSIFFHLAWIGLWLAWTLSALFFGAMTGGLLLALSIPINLVLFAGGLLTWIYLMYSAHAGRSVRIPLIGTLAARQSHQGK
jgi:uncharacterized membrane protein